MRSLRCRREGVASIYFFPNQIFFELVDRSEGVCRRYAIQQRCWQDNKKREMPIKPKSSATRATCRKSTNSTVIKQSSNSRGTLVLARLLWSILVSSSNLVTLITQEYMILQRVLRMLQSIPSMQALLPLKSLSILNTMRNPGRVLATGPVQH